MTSVQSIIFNKLFWNKRKAKKWLKKNNFIPIKKVHETKNYYRYRIKNPTGKKYRIKNLKNGVKLVLLLD